MIGNSTARKKCRHHIFALELQSKPYNMNDMTWRRQIVQHVGHLHHYSIISRQSTCGTCTESAIKDRPRLRELAPAQPRSQIMQPTRKKTFLPDSVEHSLSASRAPPPASRSSSAVSSSDPPRVRPKPWRWRTAAPSPGSPVSGCSRAARSPF